MTGFVYLGYDVMDDIIKIGFSSDPAKRCETLGYETFLSWEFSSRSEAYAVEQAAHLLLREHRAELDERFRVPVSVGVQAILDAKAAIKKGRPIWMPRILRHRRYTGLPASPEEIQRYMGLSRKPKPIRARDIIDPYGKSQSQLQREQDARLERARVRRVTARAAEGASK